MNKSLKSSDCPTRVKLGLIPDPDSDLDRHQNGKSDPDPDLHQNDANPQHCSEHPSTYSKGTVI
jgi:hypothetical protein